MAVKKTEEEKKAEETVAVIAESIDSLAKNVRAAMGGRLNKKALVILLAHSTHLPRVDVEKVLEAISGLDKTYLK